MSDKEITIDAIVKAYEALLRAYAEPKEYKPLTEREQEYLDAVYSGDPMQMSAWRKKWIKPLSPGEYYLLGDDCNKGKKWSVEK